MINSKQIKRSPNSLSVKSFFAWNLVMFLLIASMAVSSYADTLVSDYSSDDACIACPVSHSKEKSSGDQAPASDNNHCFAHFHCHHQPASLKVISFNYPGRENILTPVDSTLYLSLFVASIFHPPQIHI